MQGRCILIIIQHCIQENEEVHDYKCLYYLLDNVYTNNIEIELSMIAQARTLDISNMYKTQLEDKIMQVLLWPPHLSPVI